MMTSVAGGFAQGLESGISASAQRRQQADATALAEAGMDLQNRQFNAQTKAKDRDIALGQIKDLKAELAAAVKGGNMDGAVQSVQQLINTGVLDGLAANAGVPVESIVSTLNLAVTPQQAGVAAGAQEAATIQAAGPARIAQNVNEQAALLPGKVEEARQLGDVAIDTKVAEINAVSPLNAEAARLQQEALTPGFIERQKQVDANKAEIEAAQKRTAGPKMSDIKGLRGDYTTLSKDFVTIRDSFNRISSMPDSAAGNIGLVFALMKMFDPNSVVRESEFATAQNAAGVPDRVRNVFNRVRSGERLGAEQIADFKNVAKRLFDEQQSKQKGLEERFRAIAERSGVNPDDVLVIDTGNASAPRATVPQPPAGRPATFIERKSVGGVLQDVFQDANGKFFGVVVDGR